MDRSPFHGQIVRPESPPVTDEQTSAKSGAVEIWPLSVRQWPAAETLSAWALRFALADLPGRGRGRLYFCNLDVDTLRSMVMCCLPEVSTMQVDGKSEVAITFDPLDALNFIKHDFMRMNLMCERAEMFERRIYDRSKAIFEYFGLPFDAEPPE